MRQRAVLIIGMHRSGTSAIAAILEKLGFNFGSDLMPAAPDNPHGFFEHRTVTSINQRILFDNKTTWDDPRPVKFVIHRNLVGLIHTVLERDFSHAPLYALKDPRISLFPELYLSSLAGRGVHGSTVLMVRDPRDVAASLLARNGIAPAESASLWLKHTLSPLHALAAKPPVVVLYDDLLDNRNEVQRIAHALDVSNPGLAEQATDALSHDLRHHHNARWLSDLNGQSCEAMISAMSAYDAIRRFCVGDIDMRKLLEEMVPLLQRQNAETAFASFAMRRINDIFGSAISLLHVLEAEQVGQRVMPRLHF